MDFLGSSAIRADTGTSRSCNWIAIFNPTVRVQVEQELAEIRARLLLDNSF